jgi:Do/DeqQ family serine protease
MSKQNLIQLTLVAVLSSVLTIGIFRMTGWGGNQVVLQQVSNSGSENLAKLAKKENYTNVPTDFIAVAEKATPSVVHIHSKYGGNRTTQRRNQDEMPDLFREFFGDDFPRQFRGPQGGGESSGSGVIVSQDGYIVTNNHVVADASEVEVVMSDKRTYKAEVIGTAPTVDLAVIKIKEKNLPNMVFGNSDEVKVGEWVLAVGNPFNLESTVTAGIVSAKGRNLNILRDKGADAIESFIQTDAAVNPGNSGGALINTKGELVGINTAIATPTGTYAGYSFAVPANIVIKVMKDLIEYGSLQRGYLGVEIRELDGKFAEEKGIKDITEGVYVGKVSPSSAAAEAGVKEGDVIVGMDGKKIKSSPELLGEIARRRPGDKVNLEIVRNGKKQNFSVFLKSKEGSAELSTRRPGSDEVKGLGGELEEVSKDEMAQLRIQGGAKVAELGAGKLRESGMQEGFVITKINGQAVKSVEDFINKYKQIQPGDDVYLRGKYLDSTGEHYYGFAK